MEETVKLITTYQEKAREEIRAAKLLADSDLYTAATSRAYYACFYAITSLLLQEAVEAKSHKQLAIEFRKRFIKTGRFDEKFSRILDQLFKKRMLFDYNASIAAEVNEVERLIALAEEFVTKIVDHLRGGKLSTA